MTGPDLDLSWTVHTGQVQVRSSQVLDLEEDDDDGDPACVDLGLRRETETYTMISSWRDFYESLMDFTTS